MPEDHVENLLRGIDLFSALEGSALSKLAAGGRASTFRVARCCFERENRPTPFTS